MDKVPGAQRVLVAGIGNIFCADDGFGVEVIKRLARMPLPDGVKAMDFGIRGLHLAYEMLDGGYDRVILVDALPQKAAPGTLAVVQPELTADESARDASPWDAHAMQPAAVLQLLQRIGGCVADVLVVGCQPARLDEEVGLSPAVAAAVDDAAQLILRLVSGEEDVRVPGNTGADRRTQS
jgi:hydrogenase maturation protease